MATALIWVFEQGVPVIVIELFFGRELLVFLCDLLAVSEVGLFTG